jgi:hypothetical protein
MNRRCLLVATFPIILLCLLAAERIATILLAYFPFKAEIWHGWSLLHSAFGEFWRVVGPTTGDSFGLQLILVGICIVLSLLASRTRRWVTFGFLANHAALILAGASTLAAARPALSMVDFDTLPEASLKITSSFSPLQISILTIGVTSCAFCHLVFWLEARHRRAPIELQIRLLQAGL